MQERNAVILSADLHTENGCLDFYVTFDYGASGQQLGGYALYLPEGFTHHHILSPAGHLIYRLLKVAGVERWSQLPGKTVRVLADYDRVYAVGHIIHDDWFRLSEISASAEDIEIPTILDRTRDKEGDSHTMPLDYHDVAEFEARIVDLERQRDWLAAQHVNFCFDAATDACVQNTGDCPLCPLGKGGICLEVTSETFIAAAKKATKVLDPEVPTIPDRTWGKEGDFFTTPPDYHDAAEFEARVALYIAESAHNLEVEAMLLQHQGGDDYPLGWYILREARLAVEQEMEREYYDRVRHKRVA